MEYLRASSSEQSAVAEQRKSKLVPAGKVDKLIHLANSRSGHAGSINETDSSKHGHSKVNIGINGIIIINRSLMANCIWRKLQNSPYTILVIR